MQNATELAESSEFKALLNSATVITDEQRRVQVVKCTACATS